MSNIKQSKTAVNSPYQTEDNVSFPNEKSTVGEFDKNPFEYTVVPLPFYPNGFATIDSNGVKIPNNFKDMTVPEFKFALRDDLLNNKEFLPTKGEPNAVGWDVRAAWKNHDYCMIQNNQYCLIPLGFRAFIPQGWWLEMRPRSSTFAKKHLNCLYGVIDTDYSLELMLAVQLSGSPDIKIQFGEALGQIIPVRKETMLVSEITNEELDHLVAEKNPVRTGGFGSTSK